MSDLSFGWAEKSTRLGQAESVQGYIHQNFNYSFSPKKVRLSLSRLMAI